MMDKLDIYAEAKNLWFDVAGGSKLIELDMLRTITSVNLIEDISDY